MTRDGPGNGRRSRWRTPRGAESDPFAEALADDAWRSPGMMPMAPGSPVSGSPSGARAGNAPGFEGDYRPPLAQPVSPVDQFGRRTASALNAIDFPTFISGLITGTFQGIVDSTAQQMREYAHLVSSLAQTVGEFARQNVTIVQVCAGLAEQYGADLYFDTEAEPPTLVPRSKADGTSPGWLKEYGLAGQELSEELCNTALVHAAQQTMAKQRMQQLATMVLMGINRIVIDRGDIKAKLMFHATATDRNRAGSMSVAGGQSGAGERTTFASQYRPTAAKSVAAISTAKANVQRDAAMRADLMGEVRIRFSTETFPLESFANSVAIQLINDHATPPPPSASGTDGSSTDSAQKSGAPEEQSESP